MNEITSLKMKAISLINEIFVPLGLKPIEDLPKACPKDGRECVLAVILQSNPDWQDIFVSGSSAQFRNIKQSFTDEEYSNIAIPSELNRFIHQFDSGNMPELIDLESMDKYWSDGDPDGQIMMWHKMKDAGIDIGNRLEQEVTVV